MIVCILYIKLLVKGIRVVDLYISRGREQQKVAIGSVFCFLYRWYILPLSVYSIKCSTLYLAKWKCRKLILFNFQRNSLFCESFAL